MLHLQYLREGSQIEIPELSSHVSGGSATFNVIRVHAGGMGICVHLRHTETKTEYVLKGVRPDYVNNMDSLDRFLDELRVWLSASMCNFVSEAIAVVRINETPCVLGVWMHGGDLAHALPNFNSRQKFEALIRIVRGLAWVRENIGVIHRDLKPANVLLDQNGLAYVADWGLARPVGHAMASIRASLNEDSIKHSDRTQVGSFLGTVTYAAPEQILGSADIDHRADIYALGCMMFEFETGSPPFVGRTIAEIARQHIQMPPPKLGGLFKQTKLGLERVIASCMEKDPASRYSDYEELDKILVELARKKGITVDHCIIKIRYQRPLLGKGHQNQNLVLDKKATKGTGDYAVVEFDDILPFFEEAINLMALKRYAEAEKILRPHFVPEFFETLDQWGLPHAVAVNYAYCLMEIGQLADAEAIFASLNKYKEKIAEFYVNYSLTLLKLNKWKEAIEICKRGLHYFPDDLDILGNLTISLANFGDISGARESAIKRLNLRRDVHSIEEVISVLLRQAKLKRDIDLPEAVSMAKVIGDLIREGLAVNLRFYSLRITEIQLRRFAYDEKEVLNLYQVLEDIPDCPEAYKHLATCEMLECLAKGKSFQAALDMIERGGNNISKRLLGVKMRILARQFMIGKNDSDGQRVVIQEVCNYFLNKTSDQSFRDPVLAAELFEWLNDPVKAVSILKQHLSIAPTDWGGVRRMALLHQHMDKPNVALHYAQLLPTIAPWRAESFDTLSYVAEQINRPDIAQQAKQRGDEVFEKENALFDDLRVYLDELMVE